MVKIDPELRERLNAWDWFVLVVALVALTFVILETFLTIPPATLGTMIMADRIACGVFFADMIVRWRRDGWSRRFWRHGWLDLIASIPFDAAFRTFQVFRVYRVVQILRTLYKLRELTAGTSFNEKLLIMPGVAFVMVLFSTNLMLEFEAGAPGATIRTGGDALWWALTTVTTVGYGDTYPVTAAGRSIAAVMMVVGIALFGSMSALLTSRLILPREAKEHADEMKEISKLREEIRGLRDELARRDRKE
jgi:voltage-gated potassium channel